MKMPIVPARIATGICTISHASGPANQKIAPTTIASARLVTRMLRR